ncbi:hypothetical protein QUF80_14735 [Desulfococcaceae bacterium HSG8]|nr:hypothetical protein [Desulfococcaceae bacterium HSG8]
MKSVKSSGSRFTFHASRFTFHASCREDTMKKLLRLDKDGRWELGGIEFAIRERVGKPHNLIGRVSELEYLYTWADNIRQEISRSVAFLGRRKIGKSLILERLYNIIYSEHKGLIPFYYEFTEGTRSGREFYHDFVTRFYMQVVGYYTRDISWIRSAADFNTDADAETFMKDIGMHAVNHVNMRRITYFLCRHEGEWYYPRDLKRTMNLDIGDEALRGELALLHKYDLIEFSGGRYGGVFDRTLKKVLMKHYGDILGLPAEEFNAYFRTDNLLDYLQERIRQLELDLAEAEELRNTMSVLRGEHNDLKGHYYEREVLLRLIKAVIDGEGGVTDGIGVTEFDYTLNYHLSDGQEIDIVLEGKHTVVMAECKNYAPEYLHRITEKMVKKFADKARRLKEKHFPEKALRLIFFSRNGVEEKLKPVLRQHGIFLH